MSGCGSGGDEVTLQPRKKPALMLPMGQRDWERAIKLQPNRMNFMESCHAVLDRLGWTFGIELKGGKDIPDWALDCCDLVTKMGGRVTWHLPNNFAKTLSCGNLADEHLLIAGFALGLKTHGLESVTMHCAPAVSIDPPEDMGYERYNSPITAEEMLAHIKAQVEPLRQLNEAMEGMLEIENVDITNFRDAGYRTPTYLQLQTGCYMDLLWLAKESGVNITFDSEHFYCAKDFLGKYHKNPEMFDHQWEMIRDDIASRELVGITGYWLRKGLVPVGKALCNLDEFVSLAKPNLFHLGGAIRATDDKDRIETHLPNFNYPDAKKALHLALIQSMTRPEVMGCVVEVYGQLDPEKFSAWAPRPYDDEIAKMMTYLEVINEIESLLKEGVIQAG